MYIQDKVEEYADEIFERLQNGAVMYFCGLKGMMFVLRCPFVLPPATRPSAGAAREMSRGDGV